MKHLTAACMIAALAALAGCTSTSVQDPFLTGATVAAMPAAIGSTREVSPQFALAALPGTAGKILAIRQTVNTTSARQEIVLGSQTTVAGENLLTVDIGPAREKQFRQAPSQTELQREMRAALPGVAMTMNLSMNNNAYGIYGYASGKITGGGTCIYAWQIANTLGQNQAASVRLRLCHATASVDRLAGLMQGLSLKSIGSDTIAMLRLAGQSSLASTTLVTREFSDSSASAYGSLDEEPAVLQEVAPRKRKASTKSVETMASAAEEVTKPTTTVTTTAVTVPLPKS